MKKLLVIAMLCSAVLAEEAVKPPAPPAGWGDDVPKEKPKPAPARSAVTPPKTDAVLAFEDGSVGKVSFSGLRIHHIIDENRMIVERTIPVFAPRRVGPAQAGTAAQALAAKARSQSNQSQVIDHKVLATFVVSNYPTHGLVDDQTITLPGIWKYVGTTKITEDGGKTVYEITPEP